MRAGGCEFLYPADLRSYGLVAVLTIALAQLFTSAHMIIDARLKAKN
jgi:hypothetical protein